MKFSLILLVLFAGMLHAEDAVRSKPPLPAIPGKALWRTSLTALAAANALDAHSSWGKHELNRTLAGPSGNFGRDGALIKLSLQGGLIGIEWLIARRHPSGRLYRALSCINFGASAAIGAVAIHNYTVPRPTAP